MQFKNIMNDHLKIIDDIILLALKEDLMDGDITTDAIFTKSKIATAELVIKDTGIIAGLNIFEKVFHKVDPEIKIEKKINDSEKVKFGDIAASVTGTASSILKGERTALNFLQRMSGVATITNQFVEIVKHTKAKILDTRKTMPGMRLLDKEAVKIGGGTNHRIGLFDMFLIKDNHIAAAGSITKAVDACKAFKKLRSLKFKIEVETKNLDEVNEALSCNVDIIMLDNFDLQKMKDAVKLIEKKCLTEFSGNVNLTSVKSIAETGVDFISVGALTHSAKALDISLKFKL